MSFLLVCVGSPSVVSAASPPAQLWAERYNGAGNRADSAVAVIVSPTGGQVFVTGTSAGSTSGRDYATLAYDASGGRVWTMRYDGPGSGPEYAGSVAMSPDGTKVFVTGASSGSTSDLDYATVGYDASTGAELWASRYNGPSNDYEYAHAVAVSPDGSTVFVTGYSLGSTSYDDYATVAYDAVTGTELWASRYDGPSGVFDVANGLAVSPDGTKVFVTGQSDGAGGDLDYATIAYDASSGAELWTRRYNGRTDGSDSARAVAVSPDGNTVFVTGYSQYSIRISFATVAYKASNGVKLWGNRSNEASPAFSFAVSPAGTKVFVTGSTTGRTSADDVDYRTMAYAASTGAKLWGSRYNGPGNGYDVAEAVAASPDGTTVFVTGRSRADGSHSDYATIAYDASNGIELWTKRYNGPGNHYDGATSVAVSQAGTVFVSGGSTGSTSGRDFATVAYGA
jgi:outer membrane protein assembly factor BamB